MPNSEGLLRPRSVLADQQLREPRQPRTAPALDVQLIALRLGSTLCLGQEILRQGDLERAGHCVVSHENSVRCGGEQRTQSLGWADATWSTLRSSHRIYPAAHVARK